MIARLRARWATWRNRQWLKQVARKLEIKIGLRKGSVNLSINPEVFNDDTTED